MLHVSGYKRIDKVQFLGHGNAQLFGQFQVAPHQLYQPTHISGLLIGVVSHLTVQNVKNEMGETRLRIFSIRKVAIIF